MQGTVKWFSAQKGYGFITDADGKDYFCHYTSIKMDGFKTLREGQLVTFDIGENKDGKAQAENVALA